MAAAKRIIAESGLANEFAGLDVSIPRLTVVGTDVFEQFMTQNGLYEIASADSTDERIAHAFLQGELPPLIVGDLRRS
ncbi:MAG: hypothetical protein R3E58_01195 [Phycisphaerae bacterium]